MLGCGLIVITRSLCQLWMMSGWRKFTLQCVFGSCKLLLQASHACIDKNACDVVLLTGPQQRESNQSLNSMSKWFVPHSAVGFMGVFGSAEADLGLLLLGGLFVLFFTCQLSMLLCGIAVSSVGWTEKVAFA